MVTLTDEMAGKMAENLGDTMVAGKLGKVAFQSTI